ncbi:LuxR C-terminal-related transcriptional regulator [Saccharopolyspora sp. SCSIO 74807]|uniref:helix-turn-helix transcriptional regulator n=1 Tax=Saccharopolyspora sp. SCSIO 74807 TaxID=3118084 RepID=UPI0030CF987A
MGREQIAGRSSALAALRAAWRDGAWQGTATRCHGRLVLLRGPAGIGKTRLMDALVRPRRAEQQRVWVDGRAATDARGLDVVLDALREDFDRFGRRGLVDAVDALARLRARPESPVSTVIGELTKVFSQAGAPGVLVDDALEIIDPAPLLIAARRAGCAVVAAVRDDAASVPMAAELAALADEVIDLEPLSAEQTRTAVGGDLHEDVHRALQEALGPLYGNPGAALGAARMLRASGRLVPSGDGLRLADAAMPVLLPPEHELLQRIRPLGRLASKLLAAAGVLGVLDVDELPQVAAALREDAGECGRLVDQLVALGALVGDEWGRFGCLCPALAATAAAEEPAVVRRMRVGTVVRPMQPRVPTRSRCTAGEAVRPERGWPGRDRPERGWSAIEVRMVELIGSGCTNRRIASEFGVSEKTVEAHLTRLFAKTGCRSRVELVAANLHGRAGAPVTDRAV